MKSLITIIIPCYNHAHYLADALNSVLAQTYTEWEAIVVDDGSTDNTREIAAQFTDPRIRYIYQENQGLSAARNTGIRHARGAYLNFLDADDELEPTFLSACLVVLDNSLDCPAVYSRTSFIDSNGDMLPRVGWDIVKDGEFKNRLVESNFFPVHSVLVRKEAVIKAGFFDETLTSLEDWDLWLRISRDGVFCGLGDVLVRYRIYSGSMSTDVARMYANRVAVLTKYFGPVDLRTDMPVEGRLAWSLAYRFSSFEYLCQGEEDKAKEFFVQAITIWPDLLKRLDTFYELACVGQSRESKGRGDALDIQASAQKMFDFLYWVFSQDMALPALAQRIAFGHAYLSLAMLSDQAGQWSIARSYLLKALLSNTRLAFSWSVVRRAIKLCIGYRMIKAVRRARYLLAR